MSIRLLISLLIIFLSFTIYGQGIGEVNSAIDLAEIGILEEKLSLIDNHIQEYIDEGHLPGGVFMIARKGKVFYNKTFGDREPGIAYNEDDIFRLASMTKAVTTVSIMQLYEQGKLGLDDPIFYYIPDFKEMLVAENINQEDSTYTTRPARTPITFRHLLTHTSGITYGVFQGGAIQAMYDKFGANEFGLTHESVNTIDMAKTIAKVPLIFEPGSAYSYGLNMEVLGALVEVISDKPLNEYVKENILDPLNIEDMEFYLSQDKHSRLVPLHTVDENGKLIISDDPAILYPKESGRTNFAGGGGMSGTAAAYLTFISALENDGVWNGTRILSRKTIDVMTSDQMIELNNIKKGFSRTPGITYSLGFALVGENGQGVSHKSPGTYEWGGLFNTKFFIDPKEDLVFVGMTQILPFSRPDFWDKFYAIIYSSLE